MIVKSVGWEGETDSLKREAVNSQVASMWSNSRWSKSA